MSKRLHQEVNDMFVKICETVDAQDRGGDCVSAELSLSLAHGDLDRIECLAKGLKWRLEENYPDKVIEVTVPPTQVALVVSVRASMCSVQLSAAVMDELL
ncbi:hypothetical protein [Pseudomonas baltica]|uniref:hypothetical protein n=1 Tax=Pseudomonas baltica TaxID=2762576 RepID=UPI00289F0115|nr:hypothetical protein [Pseudomonas baltica]